MRICARERCKLEFKPYNAKQIYCCKQCTNTAFREQNHKKPKDSHIPDSMDADKNAYDWLAQ